MKVINKTKKTILAPYIQKKTSFFAKSRGLIGKNENQAIMFSTHFGIHTFGVFHPIDVIILDPKNNVVALRQELKPNRIFLWNPLYSQVLELPAGTIQKSHTTKGDHVEMR